MPKTMKKTAMMSVSLPLPLIDSIKKEAIKEDRSISNFVKRAIQSYLNRGGNGYGEEQHADHR